MQDKRSGHKQSISIPGLKATVDILIDCYGIAHIYAANDHDVFFTQGFNAARDRLWQLDLWRRRGLGLMAQVFGPAYVERDRAARLMLYRGDMDAEWGAYGPEARAWIEAFTAGINAYIDYVSVQLELLPFEFVTCGFKPSHWMAEDVLRCRAHARVRNLDTEIARANVATQFGLQQAAMVKALDPPWPLRVPHGVELEHIPEQVLHTYRLATTYGDLDAALSEREFDGLDGSNNWAVSPKRSTTGRAMLATDPHRAQQLPSLRYTVHLNAPGLNVIGAGEPAIPGVSLGHNDDIAFGLTIFPCDQEDLYVYELDPSDPERYRYGDGFESMRIERENVPVLGGASRQVTLRFTRHGPVLHVDRACHRAYALRTVWSEPGTAAYVASLSYQRARSWEQFVAAQRSWGAPSVNHVYADTNGNIGWITAGKIPVRANWDGLLPVPGDGRFEWQGFMSSACHPREYNPERQWVASANQINLPPEFDHAQHKTGFEFAPAGRFQRIREVLESRAQHSLDDFAQLQADVKCPVARQLVACLHTVTPFGGDAQRAREMLCGWDQRLSIDSSAAALFEVWFRRHLIPLQMHRDSPEAVVAHIEVPDTTRLVEQFMADATADDWRLTLASAWQHTTDLLGPSPNDWAWGRLHQAMLHHPLSSVLGPRIAQHLDVGPLPKSGSALTVNNNGYRESDFRVVHGVSWRMLADVGNWDDCLMINSPGQSGNPASHHYQDHFSLWAREEYVPMLFTRASVEAALERHIVLVPSDPNLS